MNSVTFKTGASRRWAWAQRLGLATTVVTAWALSAGTAQARGDDVYWSVGVSSPGVAVGVSNAPPLRVVVQPQPVVIHQPAPVVIHQPYPYVRPVVVQPRPVVYEGWGPYWEHRHDRRYWKHRHHDRYDRYDRDDRYGRGDDRWDDDRRGDDRRR